MVGSTQKLLLRSLPEFLLGFLCYCCFKNSRNIPPIVPSEVFIEIPSEAPVGIPPEILAAKLFTGALLGMYPKFYVGINVPPRIIPMIWKFMLGFF